MLSRLARIVAVCAALGNLGAAPAGSAPKPILERVVVVMRHGVRAPTKSVDVLSKYSVERWPDWSVGVGELSKPTVWAACSKLTGPG
jgi:4-phytase/acid phosphatase